MSNYQVLFNGDVLGNAKLEAVRENLARELGLDERKAKQLFSGRTVVIRSQLEQHEAQAWQDRFAELGAICRIKNLVPKDQPLGLKDGVEKVQHDRTLRDITAAHLECPRCGHTQLDASHCTRCGVDLEAAHRQKRKEDIMIEKKIRELRAHRENPAQATSGRFQNHAEMGSERDGPILHSDQRNSKKANKGGKKGGVLHWLKRN